MSRVLIAFRVFFAALFSGDVATRLQQALALEKLTQTEATTTSGLSKPIDTSAPIVRPPKQSEAITLLAALQREARLIDFLKEDLSGYPDEQVGAAVRDVQRESAAAIDRMFALQPILGDGEGSTVEVPAGFDPARYRLSGKLIGEPPFRGTLRHQGWEATKCELPEFTGSESAGKTVMPAEVEVQ